MAIRPRRGVHWSRVVLFAVLVAGAGITVLPFLYMISTSLKTLAETLTRISPFPFNPEFWPRTPRWSNYSEAWRVASFGIFFKNSVIIAVTAMVETVIISALSAYAFSKIPFAGREILFTVLLSTLIIPETVYLIPNVIIVSTFGWMNTLAGLTLPFVASAFYIFLLRQFFNQVPNELLEVSRIDGAGRVRSFLSIMLPLSKAPLFTVAFLSFIGSWNALQWPLVVTQGSRWRPLTVGLTMFISEAGPEMQLRMSGAVIAIAPVILLYFVAQKQFTEAITRSGIKG
jgi:ABC-type glycerol-3-phosphate transport system permease component